jgi:hypothetical protein
MARLETFESKRFLCLEIKRVCSFSPLLGRVLITDRDGLSKLRHADGEPLGRLAQAR